jgi:MtaA/CmuA family methyltransferase
MSPKERVHFAMSGQPVDFAPRTPIVMQRAAQEIGRNYGEFVSDHHVLVESNIACAQRYGLDQVSCISDPYRETEGFGAHIRIVPSGPLCEVPVMTDLFDYSLLKKPDPEASVRMRDRMEAIRLYRSKLGDSHSILGWVEGAGAESGDLRGVENFMVDMLEEPEGAAALLDHCLTVAIAFAKAQVTAGADVIGVGEALASQVSRSTYEELLLPRQQRLVAAIHEAGARVRMHICGNITHLLPGLATLNLEAIDVDHMVDLADVRRVLGPRVMIGANLDPVADLLNGKPEPIRAKLRACYEKVGSPFCANAGCEIPLGTPAEAIAALCEPLPL